MELQVILDFGNSDIKAMLHGAFGKEIVFPHAVLKPSPSEFRRMMKQQQFRPAIFDESAIFEYGDTGYVVGRFAATQNYERLLGPAKYRRDHLGALFCAAMLQLYPHSHDDVTVIVLHPTDVSAENIEALAKAIGGKHTVKTPSGETITYKVKRFIPMDEPSAVFMTFLLSTDSAYYKRQRVNLTPGSEILVLDVGGGLSSFVPVTVTRSGQLVPNTFSTPPIRAGIQDVAEVFESEIKSTYYEKAGKIQGLPLSMLHNALATDFIQFSGESYTCEEAVQKSMAVIANPIAAAYNRDYANGLPYSAIIIGGGGGAIAYDYLVNKVLNHNFVYPAEDDLDRMRFGGIRGASKGYALNLKLPPNK